MVDKILEEPEVHLHPSSIHSATQKLKTMPGQHFSSQLLEIIETALKLPGVQNDD